MLRWSAAFFIIAIVAALRIRRNAAGAVDIAKVLFVFFLLICAILLVWGLFSGRRPRCRRSDRNLVTASG
jgi:uncharacterized membrane protein YtjA (UPF0391 family)